FIQHLSELTLKSYILACSPVLVIMLVMQFIVKEQEMSWMLICFILMILISVLLYKKSLFKSKWPYVAIISLFIIQQIFILANNYVNNIKKYESTISSMHDSKYKSPPLAKKIESIKKGHDNPLS